MIRASDYPTSAWIALGAGESSLRFPQHFQIHGNLVDFLSVFYVLEKKGCKDFEKSQNYGIVQRIKKQYSKTVSLKNEAFVAKIGVDTVENEPEKEK